MTLKWIFALILLVYGLKALSSEIAFNEAIEESYKAQLQLASQVQKQVGVDLAQQKTPAVSTGRTVTLEGSSLKIF